MFNILNICLNSIYDDKLKINNKYFYFDYKSGEYGYNTSSSRGADTFHPFKKDHIISVVFGGTTSAFAIMGDFGNNLTHLNGNCTYFKIVNNYITTKIGCYVHICNIINQYSNSIQYYNANVQLFGIAGGNNTIYLAVASDYDPR